MKKKGQFLILSGMFIILLSIFIYSLETDNYYKVNLKDSNVVENIQSQTCNVLKLSNGSQLFNRKDQIIQIVEEYCLQRNIYCSLSIVNNTIIPPLGNFTLLNYTHYNLSLELMNSTKNYNSSFIC